ncbi:MAG: GNAT family N-acetyltransferase [Planctomycetota bacterium]|nr:GNAT family N-acetyltransferase [Planctomycetota bacterium]
MLSYRPFLNGDIPSIVAIWKNHGPDPALAKEISADLFDRLVLSKLYFDRRGLIMAVNDGQVVGFVHAGFGPNEDETELDTTRGVVSLLLTHEDQADSKIADGLLTQAEAYLMDRGAHTIGAIGLGELCPFYLGLYGSCDLPGIFDSDTHRTDFFKRHNYQPNAQILCFRKEISQYRPTTNRTIVRLRRSLNIEFASDPSARSWWDACTQGCLPQLSATVRSVGAHEIFAKALFWDMQTLTGPESRRSMGLSRLNVTDPAAPPGTGSYLLEESFKQLKQQGIQHVLAQCDKQDTDRRLLLESAGMEHYDTGTLWSKKIS